jgi:hypothetical protein
MEKMALPVENQGCGIEDFPWECGGGRAGGGERGWPRAFAQTQ